MMTFSEGNQSAQSNAKTAIGIATVRVMPPVRMGWRVTNPSTRPLMVRMEFVTTPCAMLAERLPVLVLGGGPRRGRAGTRKTVDLPTVGVRRAGGEPALSALRGLGTEVTVDLAAVPALRLQEALERGDRAVAGV